ncbi:MAG TPA: hypothetical protein PKD50_20485, partial [Leptospiraceae bacterium]|nr:hypothetical protein [Leptospiraceae bacterium]
MKIFRIVLVLCVLNTFIFAQEETINKEEPTDAKTTAANASIEKMSQDIKDYFKEEKAASLYYLGAGGLTTAMGLYYRREAVDYYPSPKGVKQDNAYYLGLSYPLLGVGVFQLATGGFMYFKSDKRAKDLEKELEANPASFREQELSRIENVAYWNKIFRYAQYGMIGGGLWAWYAGNLSDKDYMKGFGQALFLQGVISFALDYFTNKRTDAYREKLINFNFSYIPPTRNINSYAVNGTGVNG